MLVIMLALGVVVVGLQPIRGDLRHFATEARRFARERLPLLFGDLDGDEPSSTTATATSRRPLELGEREPKPPPGITIDRTPGKQQQLDKLSKEDRKQLSELVNGF